MTTWFEDVPERDESPLKLPNGFLAMTRAVEVANDDGIDHPEPPDYLYEPWWVGMRRHSVVFEPIGFLKVSDYVGGDIGNGDHFGLYWPIGREDRDPLVARSSHDCQGITPIASTLKAADRLGASIGLPEGYRGDPPFYQHPGNEEGKVWSAAELVKRLEIDPGSPYLLVAFGVVKLADGQLDEAERLYLRAIASIPEYTAAQIGLAEVYRRMDRPADECRIILKALRSPLSFDGGSWWAEDHLTHDRMDRREYRPRLLSRLRDVPTHQVGDSLDDPLFRERASLEGRTGLVDNPEYRILDRLIDQYLDAGRPLEAVGLAVVYGELMNREHWAFYKIVTDLGKMMKQTEDLFRRNDFSERTQMARLLKTFEAAGLSARVALLVLGTRDLDLD